MKKFTKILLASLSCSLFLGSAMATPYDWGVIEPTAINGAPSYIPGQGLGY